MVIEGFDSPLPTNRLLTLIIKIMGRTKKQIQAQRRNEMLFQIAGMLATLKRFQSCYLASNEKQELFNRGTRVNTGRLVIRGRLNVAIVSLEETRDYISQLTRTADWHDIFNG